MELERKVREFDGLLRDRDEKIRQMQHSMARKIDVRDSIIRERENELFRLKAQLKKMESMLASKDRQCEKAISTLIVSKDLQCEEKLRDLQEQLDAVCLFAMAPGYVSDSSPTMAILNMKMQINTRDQIIKEQQEIIRNKKIK